MADPLKKDPDYWLSKRREPRIRVPDSCEIGVLLQKSESIAIHGRLFDISNHGFCVVLERPSDFHTQEIVRATMVDQEFPLITTEVMWTSDTKAGFVILASEDSANGALAFRRYALQQITAASKR